MCPGARWVIGLAALLAGWPGPLRAADPQVEAFSPQGAVKGVRQVVARFNAPIVPFGAPRLREPFDIDCTERGTARWADARNWVFDFARDLPAGVSCTFRLKAGLTTLDGQPVTGQREFRFTTGGPAIRHKLPYEGGYIDEEQVFLLGLDAPADAESVRRHAWCDIEGIQEKVGVRLLGAAERRELFEHRRELFDPRARHPPARRHRGRARRLARPGLAAGRQAPRSRAEVASDRGGARPRGALEQTRNPRWLSQSS